MIALCASVKASPFIQVSPDVGKVKLTVNNLPLGKGVVVLTSDDLNSWVVAKDEHMKLCFYLVPDKEDKLSVCWYVPTEKCKSFFKVIVLNYKND